MYLEPTQAQGAAFFGVPREGPVVMLNLLRFREIADYAASPELKPEMRVSGREAYRLYAAHTLPHLAAAGSEILFQGTAEQYLIGPDTERWELVILVKHASAEAFLSFAQNPEYLAGIGHRTAALADSRLLPVFPST
ncbi:MAG: DUF1330 domain-containing protein [Myxococcota bacterium]